MLTVRPRSHENTGHMSGPGKPRLVLASSAWVKPESGAASLQYACEQAQDPMLHLANPYPWLGLLVSLVDRVAEDYVFGPSDGDGQMA
ncbi:hypothetical protein ABBQ38_011478 [Trebouxia sp. C0009 RCD-2024]